MNLYFLTNHQQIMNEIDKILVASTFLEGDAMDWFELTVQEYFDSEEYSNKVKKIMGSY
jgi:hypothetical protein